MLPQALLVVALLALTVRGVVRRAWYGVLGAWCFLILAPTSSILPIGIEIATERRMYLPLAGLVVLCVASAYWVTRRSGSERRWPRIVAAGIVIQQIGPRPMKSLSEAAKEAGLI